MIDSFWMVKASTRLAGGGPSATLQGPDFKKPENQKPLNPLVSLLGEITERMLH